MFFRWLQRYRLILEWTYLVLPFLVRFTWLLWANPPRSGVSVSYQASLTYGLETGLSPVAGSQQTLSILQMACQSIKQL